MSARILDITPEQYHRDPCVTPSLSASIAKVIADRSLAHARAAHPRFGAAHREPTKSMERGTVAHRLVLGKGADYVEVHGVDSYSTKAAQKYRDEIRASGRVPLLTHQLLEAVALAESVKSSLADVHGIRFTGQSEVAMEWMERLFLSDSEVQCRCMMDHLIIDDGVIYDLKFVASAHPEVVAKSIVTYGYDIQWAAYTSALQTLRPELAGRVDFQFLFCEVDAPYVVQPYRLSGEFREHGQRRWDRAKSLWHRALTSGEWPAYSNDVQQVSPPGWAMAKELGQYGE